MNNERYNRQIRLKDFGLEAQKKLKVAKVLVVGAGGLGIPVLQYLNAMGVGTLGIVEQDIIESTNLHRQVMYYENEVGLPKIEVLHQKLKEQNSSTHLELHDSFLIKENALKILEPYDVVVDATDNFGSRYLINDSCVILNKPMVYGALHGFEGQVCVFNHRGGATYRCLFPSIPKPDEIPDCNQNGVLGIIPGIIGNFQALEVVKLITGIGDVLSGKLMIYNGLVNSLHRISVPVNQDNLNITELADSYQMNSCQPELEVSPKALAGLISSDNTLQIVDVRSPDEYQSFHLSGSISIPLTELQERISEISEKFPVYLVCQSGIRSQQALQILRDSGFSGSFYHVPGGIDQYKIHSS